MHFQHYFSYIVTASLPTYALLEDFLPVSLTIFFPSQYLLTHITMVNGDRCMALVAMTIIGKKLVKLGIEPAT